MRKVLCLIAFVATTAWGQCPESCEPGYGAELGYFMGIVAKSNGACTEEPCTASQAEYQCVDLAKKFATEYHEEIYYAVGSAANMWSLLPQNSGYLAIANESSVIPPQVGDLVIWWGGTAGHVGVISRTMRDGVEVFEQNINNSAKPFRALPMNQNDDGTWKVGPGERLSSYEVKDWLRYPGFPQRYYLVGHDANGYSYREFLNTYVEQGDQPIIGNPINDGATPYVHVWEPHGFLVQNFDHGTWGSSAIVMRQGDSIAYSLHGAFWWYFWYYDVPDDLPISEEVVIGNDVYQDFESGVTYHWNLTWPADHEVEVMPTDGTGGSDVSISLLGQSDYLVLEALVISESSVKLMRNNIGDFAYAVYQNSQYLVEMDGLELTLVGLSPETTYDFQIIASDAESEVMDASEVATVTTPTASDSSPSEPETDSPATFVLLDGSSVVEPGGHYIFSIGLENNTSANISNIRGGIYPYQSGNFCFLENEWDDYYRIETPISISSGQAAEVACFWLEVLPDQDELKLEMQADYYVSSQDRNWAQHGSFRIPVGETFDASSLSADSTVPLVFTDDFSDQTILESNWHVFANQGEVSLENGRCRIDNYTMYGGLDLIAPGMTSLADASVTLDIDNTVGGWGNQITEILLRQNNDNWVGVRIKDKESHWVWLVDSNDNQATGYADLTPGRYQLSAIGSLVVFQNLEGSGAPIHVVAGTPYTRHIMDFH